MLELELRFYKWVKLAQACCYSSKSLSRPWSLRVQGRCPVTKREVSVTVSGGTLIDLRDALVTNVEIASILEDERVKKVLDVL